METRAFWKTLTVNCATATVNATGKAIIKAAGTIEADGEGAGQVKGCVQGDSICAFTGFKHPHISASVKASA